MILLTGASGFIGKHLLNELIENYGYEKIIALTSKPIENSKYLLHNNYSFEEDYFIKNECANVDIIIMGGAFTPKRSSDSNNVLLSNSNIYTVEKLLKSNLPNLKKIIYLSTLDVYGNSEIISEMSPISPHSLYGYSKLYSEKMIENWCKEKSLDFQILRIGHVYGPGEELYQKIIPISISKAIKNEKITIFGSGNEIRSFIYIKDVIKAIVKSINCEINVGVINIVGGFQISINCLVHEIIKISNNKIEIEYQKETSQTRNLLFDNSKMLKLLSISETNLNVGLFEEFSHMKNNLKI